ncbi:aminotransferase class III-fold pyridoxal phosphate-dependent enzyme [Bacteriovoracaceae bacterium]|nr:aminotransferase class III-fold pyridoxal phosphate-dependent enzyme [Bacteriovoracaceae bacterium]
MNNDQLQLTRSNILYEEAKQLVPGGILGIRRPYNFVPGEYPIFFKKGTGGRVEDVDGNEYIDMLCAYGPIILGHREKEIDDAVCEQIRTNGFCMSLTQEVQNTLLKELVELIPCCEKGVLVKTGSDATTAAIRIARAYTGKNKILRCGYHGWHDWCVEVKGGVPEKVTEDVHEFSYNNLDQLEQLLKSHEGKVAAIIMTPIGHPLAKKVEMPNNNYLQDVKGLSKKYGVILIFDEIRTGFRINIGGAQREFGVTPDLAVFGKALGNGYSIGCVLGSEEYMNVLEEKAFLSSTFFPNSLSIIAALKNIEILKRENVLDHIKKVGNQFEEKIKSTISNIKFPVEFSGGPWMPFITFPKDDKGMYKKNRNDFYTHLIRRKIFLQPYHHGYIAFRHTPDDLEYVTQMIEESLRLLEKNI